MVFVFCQAIDVKSKAALEKLYVATPLCYVALIMLSICYDKNDSYKNTAETVYKCPECNTYDGGEVDATIVTSSMMLEAEDLGLGALWTRGFDSAVIVKALDLPDNLHLVCLLDTGYPAGNSTPSELHTQRSPLKKTVKEI